MKFFFTIFSLLLALQACKPKSAKQDGTTLTTELPSDAKSLEAQVMAVHDEVMPKMSDIQHLAMQLRERKTNAPVDETGKPNYPPAIDMNITNLKEAENAMMDWMKAYSDQYSKIPPDSVMQFLQSEYAKINTVKTTMLDAIEEANAWLTANPASK